MNEFDNKHKDHVLDDSCGCGEHEHHHHNDNCGCGEHEHHHHDDNCGCGKHEHHHHDDNCGCGDHEHHHHDNNCGCGEHEHHHEHHHQECEIHIHDGAIVGSGCRTILGTYSVIESIAAHQLELLAKWVEEKGGIIGHIKAYLECSGPGAMLSITESDSTTQIKTNTTTSVKVSIASIVFAIEPEELKTHLYNILNNIEAGARSEIE